LKRERRVKMINIHEMDLLKKRNQTLRESRERTQRLLEKTEKLGLVEVYRDFRGIIKTKKDNK